MTTWWRASRYTIRDDAIAPAELPVAAYSPWDLYEPVRGRHARAEGPHTELLEVVPEAQLRPLLRLFARTEATGQDGLQDLLGFEKAGGP